MPAVVPVISGGLGVARPWVGLHWQDSQTAAFTDRVAGGPQENSEIKRATERLNKFLYIASDKILCDVGCVELARGSFKGEDEGS